MQEFDSTLEQLTGNDRPGRTRHQSLFNPNEPQVIFWQSMRKAGKGVSIEELAVEAWALQFNVLYLWAASNLENLFFAINRNCRQFWKQWREKHKEELEQGLIREPLHCDCHKAIPILVMLPDYVYEKIKEEQVDRFNGVYYRDLEEYKELYRKGRETRIIENPKEVDVTRWKKPEKFRPFPLIKFMPFTVPRGQNGDVFFNQFLNIIHTSKKEHRIITMNPMFFLRDDKFITLEFILRRQNIDRLMFNYMKPPTESELGKPFSEWSQKEKNSHKVVIILGELKTVAPSTKLSGEAGAGKTKKSIYDFIGEARHKGMLWLFGDYQQPEDLFSGIKYLADVFVIKRATRNTLGDDWQDLFKNIEEKRNQVFAFKKPTLQTLAKADALYPKIQQLPDDLGYIVYPDESFRLQRFHGPPSHHKHTKDHFVSITGIEIPEMVADQDVDQTSDKDQGNDDISTTKKATQNKKQSTDIVMKMIDYMVTAEKKKFPQIYNELLEKEKANQIPNTGLTLIGFKQMGERYRRWRAKGSAGITK